MSSECERLEADVLAHWSELMLYSKCSPKECKKGGRVTRSSGSQRRPVQVVKCALPDVSLLRHQLNRDRSPVHHPVHNTLTVEVGECMGTGLCGLLLMKVVPVIHDLIRYMMPQGTRRRPSLAIRTRTITIYGRSRRQVVTECVVQCSGFKSPY